MVDSALRQYELRSEVAEAAVVTLAKDIALCQQALENPTSLPSNWQASDVGLQAAIDEQRKLLLQLEHLDKALAAEHTIQRNRQRLPAVKHDAIQELEQLELQALYDFGNENNAMADAEQAELLEALMSGNETVLAGLRLPSSGDTERSAKTLLTNVGEHGMDDDDDGYGEYESEHTMDEGIDEFEENNMVHSMAAGQATIITPDTMTLEDTQMVAQEIVDQMGVAEIDADMWRSLPPLVQDQVFVLMAGGELAVLAGQDYPNDIAQDDDGERAEDRGYMYRRASYAEDLHMHRTRMLDELDGLVVEEEEADADNEAELAWNLLDAAAANLTDRVDELLDLGANVNICNTSGETPLHHAVTNGNQAMVTQLLQHNADVNAELNLCSWTPLHKAAAQGNVSMVKLLASFGADVTAEKSDGDDAQALAIFNQHVVVAAMLAELKEQDSIPLVHLASSLQLACAVAIRKHVAEHGHFNAQEPLPEALLEYLSHGDNRKRRKLLQALAQPTSLSEDTQALQTDTLATEIQPGSDDMAAARPTTPHHSADHADVVSHVTEDQAGMEVLGVSGGWVGAGVVVAAAAAAAMWWFRQ